MNGSPEQRSTAPADDDATRLTPSQIDDLRAQARRAGPFVDPAALHRITRASFYPEWAEAIIGRPFPGERWLHDWEIVALSLALDAEPQRPIPAAAREREAREAVERAQAIAELEAAERARQAEYQAELDAWHTLRARLPVRVTVGHNATIGHWESGHVTGRDHIVTQDELRVGRLHRRVKAVFCETPSKKTSGRRNKDPLRGVDRNDDGKDRIPTCSACLRVAERIADKQNQAQAS